MIGVYDKSGLDVIKISYGQMGDGSKEEGEKVEEEKEEKCERRGKGRERGRVEEEEK